MVKSYHPRSDRYSIMTKQHAATASPPEPVSMKEWVVCVVDSLRLKEGNNNGGSNKNLDRIICSREYLSCALKIAHSLADQLSAVEEERGYREYCREKKSPGQYLSNNSGSKDSPSMIGTLDKSWSGCISVYCMMRADNYSKDDEGQTSANADFEPLPYAGGDKSEPADLQHLAQQISALLDNDNNNPSIDYLNVRGAILNEDAVVGRPLSANGKLEIRSLGIAFIELFSGGQIKAEAGKLFSASLSSCAARSPSLPFDGIGRSGDDLLFHVADTIEGGGDKYLGSNSGIIIGNEKDGGAEPSLGYISALGTGTSDGNPTKRRPQSNVSLDVSSQKTMVRTQSASVSVEPLKLLGLPTTLCDMISNMIDSENADAHGVGEAYEFISEVRDDLKLMIDYPNVYLQDIDLTKAANVGLQFGNSFYGRESELKVLKECYQRSISIECEMAIIGGNSGVGKSKLAREFARSVNEDGRSIFLSGRFDQLQSQPLRAITSAFDKYCAFLTVKNYSVAEKVATALKENLGEENIASLVIVMPNLANILGDDFDSTNINESGNAVDEQKRLRYLICQFVEVISRCHEEHILLFLDDCQWIDATSAALLIQLMMTGSSINDRRLFFFICYRDDEINGTHPLNLVISSVNSFGIKMTNIRLTSMSENAVNEMVSTTLSLLPRITRPFAQILHHKTNGSPLFMNQVMMELYKQRLLYPSLPRRRWVWEANKILDMSIPENVADFIAKSLDRLPSEVLSALVVLSCFGARADISLIEVLEREIQQPLIAPLEAAVADSVLGKRNGEFYFMHDKIQESAYAMMKLEERCLHHNRYGLALGFVAVREKDDKLLLTAVVQINQGGPQAVIDSEQAVVVSNLNLDAGKKAMSMSDFFSANSFFDHGISYLRTGHWNEHYDLSLELFNLAARCALMNAEHDRVKMLTGEIMRNAKSFEDQYRAISILLDCLTRSGSVPEAMVQIRTTLSSLGEELPTVTTQTVIQYHLHTTKAQLAGLTDETLLSCPAMTNPSKIMAMELLSKQFENLSFAGDRISMQIIPFKMMQISLTYGMSPLSPVGFALYGNYLTLVRGEAEEGYRYVNFSLSLMKCMPSRAYDSEVMFYATPTRLRVEPIQSSIEYFTDAYKAAMTAGSMRYALGCSVHYDNCSFWSGKKLDLVVDLTKETMKQLNYHKNFVIIALMMPIFRIELRLMGQSGISQNEDMTTAFGDKLPMLLLTMCFVKFYEGLIFREFDKARDYIEKYSSIQSPTTVNMSNTCEFFRIFYAGLVSLWVGRELGDKEWIARGVECKEEIEKLAASASKWNFENKSYLLQAEEQFCERNFEVAEALYDAAILSSKAHKFVNEEALANELAGHFYIETGRAKRSVQYFSRAFEKYNEWGAVAKAATLTKYFDKSGDATV